MMIQVSHLSSGIKHFMRYFRPHITSITASLTQVVYSLKVYTTELALKFFTGISKLANRGSNNDQSCLKDCFMFSLSSSQCCNPE